MKNIHKIVSKTLVAAGIFAMVATIFIAPVSASAYSTYLYNYGYPVTSSLVASCFASPASTYVGSTVQWISSVSGGVGSYSISWSGDEGLSGYGSTIAKVYSYAGIKNATMIVTSGGQSLSVSCSNPVNVMGTYSFAYPYFSSSNYSLPLSASCVANASYTLLGSPITWSASVTGGNGYYTYSWSGTDGLFGSGQATSFTYNTPGTKTAYVNIYSNGQTATANCSNAVTVSGVYNSGYVANSYISNITNVSGNANNTLSIGCFADPASTRINQPVTWTAEVTGGVAPYTYSWTGSDSLNGTQSSVTKYYSTYGDKSAVVAISSADGKVGTRACSNAVSVRRVDSTVSTNNSNTSVNTSTNQSSQTQVQNGTQLSGSTVFSFDSIPWGWIAILIILVLFATVMYLLFNRQKI